MSQTKKQTARLEPFKKREVKYVTPYYRQDGAWHKVEDLENNLAKLELREKKIAERANKRFAKALDRFTKRIQSGKF